MFIRNFYPKYRAVIYIAVFLMPLVALFAIQAIIHGNVHFMDFILLIFTLIPLIMLLLKWTKAVRFYEDGFIIEFLLLPPKEITYRDPRDFSDMARITLEGSFSQYALTNRKEIADQLQQMIKMGDIKASQREKKAASREGLARQIGLYAGITALPLTALTQVIIQESNDTLGFYLCPVFFGLSYGVIYWIMSKRS